MKTETQQPVRWYAAKAGNDHQGLVIEEGTGRNVAVTYDVKDAPLAALAPEMREALETIEAITLPEGNTSDCYWIARHILSRLPNP